MADGRFSRDAQLTVQQLYNNVFTNFSVSEVYCVIEGFDPEKGESPFFMFDSLILQQATGERAKEEDDSDLPQELEDEEYQYYPKQIAYFKEHFPILHLESLDDVPAAFSPAMRTCDNTQYLSDSRNDAKNAEGILYSVPFYGEHNRVRGIISVIFRTNVLEAVLLDVPFLILTDKDQAEADRLGFSMPERNNNFVLYNEKHGITVFDRRNEGIVQTLGETERDRPGEVVSGTLSSHGDGDWTLAAVIDPREYEEALSGEREAFQTKLTSLIVTMAILIAYAVLALRNSLRNIRKVDQLAKIMRDISEGEGDLTLRLSDSERGEFASLARAFNSFIASLQRMMQGVAASADGVDEAAHGLSSLASDVASVTHEQFERIGDATQAMNNVTRKVSGIAESTQSLTESADESTSAATRIKAVGERLSERSERLLENVSSSDRAIQEMIDNIRQISRTAERLSDAVLDLTRGVGDIDQQVSQIEEGAVETSRLSQAVVSDAEDGRCRVENAIEGMQVISTTTKTVQGAIGSLDDRVNEIGQVVDIISSVADETGLLALNAAIISAQAGEHGRAFAVVSGQIKELAGRVANNTDEITSLIRNLKSDSNDAISAIELGVSHAESGVSVSAQAGESLEGITLSARESGKQVERIVSAVNEHRHSARQIVERIESVRVDAEEIQAKNETRVAETNIGRQAIQAMGNLAQEVRSATHEQADGSSFIAERLEDITKSVSGINRALLEQLDACRETEDFLARLRKQATANDGSTQRMNDALKTVLEHTRKLRDGIHRFRF